MGTRNNQNFVQIPHARFISMLTYKAERAGITVKLTEESYTSKASFLDRDPLPVWKPDDELLLKRLQNEMMPMLNCLQLCKPFWSYRPRRPTS